MFYPSPLLPPQFLFLLANALRAGWDWMEDYCELILEHIGYEILLQRNPWDKDLLDGCVKRMLEIGRQ